MSKFKISKGESGNLPSTIDDGAFYVTTDTHELFVDISESERIKVGGSDSGVFIATYGTTTYAEILEAYNAGKAIFCKKDRVTAPFLGEINPGLSETGFYFSTINESVASLYKCLDSGTSTEWSISITNLMPYGNYVTATTLNNRINRTTNVNTADTNYTTLMARGEKLLDATTFDAVTDWSAQLVNGAIAWRYS